MVDIAYSKGNANLLKRGNTYMVFPYLDHDLAGLMENKSIIFSVSQIKLYSKQLLMGTAYLHRVRLFSLSFLSTCAPVEFALKVLT